MQLRGERAIQAFDGSLSVWRSPTRPLKRLVRLDRELYPGCDPGSTLIRVVNEAGQRIAGAEVFVKGELRGRTDSLGQLFVPGVASGDQLVAGSGSSRARPTGMRTRPTATATGTIASTSPAS